MRHEINFLLFALMAAATAACHHDDDDDGYDLVGQPCDGPQECYPSIDQEEIEGEVVCLSDWVEGGYCTHTCDADADCCAVEGECLAEFEQVCSPLESAPESYCFVSCEGVEDEESYCETFVHPDLHCRSTGGGSENRKVCLPA